MCLRALPADPGRCDVADREREAGRDRAWLDPGERAAGHGGSNGSGRAFEHRADTKPAVHEQPGRAGNHRGFATSTKFVAGNAREFSGRFFPGTGGAGGDVLCAQEKEGHEGTARTGSSQGNRSRSKPRTGPLTCITLRVASSVPLTYG
jgi:hypothetical protein